MSIRSEVRGSSYWITFDNPKRRNAITAEMYDELYRAMDEANANENTFLTVFTGEGDIYSSGSDFSTQEVKKRGDPSDLDYEAMYSRWMRRLISHRKAYFLCPFTAMGISAEGDSSATFQRIMGTSNVKGPGEKRDTEIASEMLLFNGKMTAQQALDRGYVSRVFPNAEFKKQTTAMVEKYSKLPKHSVLTSKELMRCQKWRREMLSVHNEEWDLLRKLHVDERTIALIKKRFEKSNL